MIMGFKEDTRAELTELSERVEVLEGIAATLRTSGASATIRPVGAAVRAATRVETRGVYDGITGGRAASTVTTPATGVDYGAIAFGLSEIKRKITDNFGNADAVAREHAGAVLYFSDVFAKSDPAFDAAEFARQANA